MAQRDQDIEQKSQKKQNKGEVHDCTSEQAYGHLACSTRCHSAQTRIRSSRSHRLENLCSCFLLGHLLLRVLPPVRSYHDAFFLFYRRSRSQISPLYSLRQYPLFSKSTPPTVLADHFTPQVFEKSQIYGKHKAKLSIVVGLYKQFIDTLQIASGLYYPWAWRASGQLLGLAGYGSEYLVRPEACARWTVV